MKIKTPNWIKECRDSINYYLFKPREIFLNYTVEDVKSSTCYAYDRWIWNQLQVAKDSSEEVLNKLNKMCDLSSEFEGQAPVDIWNHFIEDDIHKDSSKYYRVMGILNTSKSIGIGPNMCWDEDTEFVACKNHLLFIRNKEDKNWFRNFNDFIYKTLYIFFHNFKLELNK